MQSMMIYGLVAGILAVTFLLTMHQRGVSPGMYRSYVTIGGIGLLLVWTLPNPWLQAVCGLMIVNFLRDKHMGLHLNRFMPFVIFLAGGVAAWPYLDRSAVYPLLASIAGAGAILTGYSLVNVWREWRERDHIKLYAGQENVNNTQSISVVCTSATIGLAVGFSPWWWLAVPVVGFPILWQTVADWRHERSVTMGPVLMAGVAFMALPLVIGWYTLILVPLVLAGLVAAVVQALRFEKWWDSGRIRCWFTALHIGWWEAGWTVRLVGRGWQSWIGFQDFLVQVATKTNRHKIVNTKFMMSTAHNEFVQILFEHGLIGLLLVVGYCATALWSLGTGGPEAVAVYFAAVGMIGVACTLHPWTWTHGTLSECDEHGEPIKGGSGYKLFTIGSPALNWLAFLTALLVEVAR